MKEFENYEVIITGGSYSGLAAAMALGRALRRVLVIDSGEPCNRQTPRSHNFLTQDGKTPKEIAILAKQQVKDYNTIEIVDDLVVHGNKTENGFEVRAISGNIFTAKKMIFASGIKDIMPPIQGFSECWGISVLHCPYCHGYEVRNESTGILANGENGFELVKLISNWTQDVTLFSNGKSTFTNEHKVALESHNIKIVEKEIEKLQQSNGQIEKIVFKDGSKTKMKVLYARLPFTQNCPAPEQLGCALTEEGYLKTDAFQKASVHGIFACGDNVSRMRTVANAVSMGTIAGMMVNKELIEESF
jgi:thioredoxin reductase